MSNLKSKIPIAVIFLLVAAAVITTSVVVVNAVRKSTAASSVLTEYDVVLSVGNADEPEQHEISRQITEKTAQQIVSLGLSAAVLEDGQEEKPGRIYIQIVCSYDDDEFSSGIGAQYQSGAKQLANLLLSATAESAQANNRGVQKADIGLQTVPYCELTVGFFSNQQERELLKSSDYQIKLAKGIAAGVQEYFNGEEQDVQSAVKQDVQSVEEQTADEPDTAVGSKPFAQSSRGESVESSKSSESSEEAKNSKKKTMYLTFDDGPSPKYTEKILKILKRNGIKATFFLIGSNAEKYPDIVKKIAADGHTIGVHCYNHDYKKIYKSTKAYTSDFAKAQNVIRDITGTAPNIFRFPGGSVNNYNKETRKDIISTMLKNGNVYFDWNAMFGDAGDTNTVSGVLSYAINTASDSKKEIVMLAHDAGAAGNTYKALQKVIDHYKRDYSFKALEYDTNPVRF